MTRPALRPSFVDRLELRSSTGRTIDGLWIGTVESDCQTILRRVEQALVLIRLFDPHRYNRIRRDLSRIWVRLLPGARGSFNAALRTCELDTRYVLGNTLTPDELAATIVHEATHARIDQIGIPYRQGLRHRVEAACRREEIRFASRLPDGAGIRERAERWLAIPRESWDDDALEKLHVEGGEDALRHLGAPRWVLLVFRSFRALVRTIRRLASGLTSA